MTTNHIISPSEVEGQQAKKKERTRARKTDLLSEVISISATLLSLAISLFVTTLSGHFSKVPPANTFHSVIISLDRFAFIFAGAILSFAILLIVATYITRRLRHTPSAAIKLRSRMTEIYLSALDESLLNPENSKKAVRIADDSSTPGRYKLKV